MKTTIETPNFLFSRLILASLHFAAGLSLLAVETAFKDEKTKRYQSVTLNGQVKDDAKILAHVAYRFSKGRNCLVMFGDSSSLQVLNVRRKAVEKLKYMARVGHDVALLHVDTSVYKAGPENMLETNGKPYSSPSFLVYCDGLQMTYHTVFSEEELDVIEGAIVINESELMGWVEKIGKN